jgi:hypothetical protein
VLQIFWLLELVEVRWCVGALSSPSGTLVVAWADRVNRRGRVLGRAGGGTEGRAAASVVLVVVDARGDGV